jgi:hypothetical protein
MEAAEEICAEIGEPARVYQEIRYRTLDSSSRSRRVVGKAEIAEGCDLRDPATLPSAPPPAARRPAARR